MLLSPTSSCPCVDHLSRCAPFSLQVCKSDFEVFEALACDSFTLKDSEQKKEERRVKSDAWTQVIPVFVFGRRVKKDK